MVSWDIAVMAMILVTVLSFMAANGERTRVRYLQAMQRCLMKIRDMIRYEQPGIYDLLMRIDMRGTKQEKELSSLMHETANRLTYVQAPQIMQIFVSECAKRPGYGVLTMEDRHMFENLLGELGRCGLSEQLLLLDGALERMKRREQELDAQCDKRAKLIRTLGVTGGAAVFLILV